MSEPRSNSLCRCRACDADEGDQVDVRIEVRPWPTPMRLAAASARQRAATTSGRRPIRSAARSRRQAEGLQRGRARAGRWPGRGPGPAPDQGGELVAGQARSARRWRRGRPWPAATPASACRCSASGVEAVGDALGDQLEGLAACDCDGALGDVALGIEPGQVGVGGRDRGRERQPRLGGVGLRRRGLRRWRRPPRRGSCPRSRARS